MSQLGVVLLLWLAPLRLEFLPAASEVWAGRGGERLEMAMLQELTDDLRGRLQITQPVQIELVDHNPLVMSVETLGGRTGPFVVSVDRGFIHELSATEVEAAIAHELGHVWIYTHEPYVQTERLANDIAMRVISRSAFEPVYEKVWQRTGIRGNLIDFIGPPTQQQ
jgi:hypothetical protein